MSINQPVFPAYGTGQSIATSTTPAAVTNIPVTSKQLVLTATGNNCYIRLTDGSNTTDASVSDFLVPISTPRTISRSENQTRLSVVAVTGTGSLHVVGADGMTAM